MTLTTLGALGLLAVPEADACEPCADFDYLCCDTPEDGEYYLTSFEGEGMACGGYADGTWYYATSWVRWHCGAKLQITDPTSGACAVVEVADAGPAAWVEDSAGKPIIDASPRVCQDLFGTSSCGWSDHRLIEVIEVDDGTPTGPDGCLPLASPLDAELTNAGAALEPDDGADADYRTCAGASIELWFELRNTGSVPWVDVGATGDFDWGQSVRLGADGADDPFTDTTRISLEDSSNPMVNPSGDVPMGDECTDQSGCERTRFTVVGTAPAEPGIFVTRWQLTDEGRDWFGPELSARVRVEDCTPPDDDPDDPDDTPDDPDDDPEDPDDTPDDPAGPDGPPATADPGAYDLTGGCQLGSRGDGSAAGLALLIVALFVVRRRLSDRAPCE